MRQVLTNGVVIVPAQTGGAEPADTIVIDSGMLAWVGRAAELPAEYADLPAMDLGGRLVTPGLIDCHTHLVFGGDRAREFEMRLAGVSYEEIARQGGGIISTVAATRAASEDELLESALRRLDNLMAEGVTTVEVKSGYGLTVEDELKMLRVARRLEAERPVRVRTSFLGAHALPPDFRDDPEGYLDKVCLPALRAAAEEDLVDAVDAFCETIAFTPGQVERVFVAAQELGLPVKLHAEQLSNSGGAELVARFGGLSADHLEYLDAEGVAAMAQAGTVATLLPGAFYTLREKRKPPVQVLRNAGVRIAVATDCNPGSSPMESLLLAMNMACTLFEMTTDEVFAGVTTHAATALGIGDRTGTIETGKRADLAVWDAASPAELCYRLGARPLHLRLFSGEITDFSTQTARR